MSEIDNELLKQLIRDTQSMIKLVEQKGTTDFEESAETGMLRMSVVSLIGALQLTKVLPANFHVANGAVVRHL